MNKKWSKGNGNKIELKLTKYWYECLHCSHQHKRKINKIKLLNGKLVIENEVMENEIKMK